MYYNQCCDQWLYDGGTGTNKFRMYVDGSTAFCIQPGVPLKTGNQLTRNRLKPGMLFQPVKKAVGLHFCMGIKATETV